MRDLVGLRQRGLNGWRAAERLFDAAFGSGLNPLRHLGAIGFLAFWLLAASGIVLYALFDTSASGAWRSIDALREVPLGLGLLLRGVHRYSADLLVLAMGLHVVREWLHGHAWGFRRFSWLTGVPLIVFAFVAAVIGFWLNWDQLGQFSAIASAEWIDALPLLPTPMARNFLGSAAVSDRLFSLFIFVHLGVPLLMLFGLWFHIQRITRAAVWPPRALLLGTLGVLALLALAVPVVSHDPASLARVPAELRLDWLLLFVHPLTDATSPAFVWALVALTLLTLFALPWLPRRTQRAAVAVVDPGNCSGCQRCFADCPYAAITMVPHPNQRVGRLLANVDGDLCAGCGICAGACPSSTPFRHRAHLVTGIDMPQWPVNALRARLRAQLEALHSVGVARPLIVFGCDHGAASARAADGAADASAFSLLCAGQLPPSFVEYALRDGAAGVLVAACREGGCEFRLGERWTVERLQGLREPHLRARVPAERVELVHAGPGDDALVAAALARLRVRVGALTASESDASHAWALARAPVHG
ncbi:MAG: hydrogenase iron-sulfur subunit [Burkholderiales bacterium]|nr:hydrogenase iron-sulfur subunit [Burkholderiales bacterium]